MKQKIKLWAHYFFWLALRGTDHPGDHRTSGCLLLVVHIRVNKVKIKKVKIHLQILINVFDMNIFVN